MEKDFTYKEAMDAKQLECCSVKIFKGYSAKLGDILMLAQSTKELDLKEIATSLSLTGKTQVKKYKSYGRNLQAEVSETENKGFLIKLTMLPADKSAEPEMEVTYKLEQ